MGGKIKGTQSEQKTFLDSLSLSTNIMMCVHVCYCLDGKKSRNIHTCITGQNQISHTGGNHKKKT